MEQEQAPILAELNRLNQARQVARAVALVLLVVSLVQPSMTLAILRSFAWASAGLLSFLYASSAKKAGLAGSYVSAFVYWAVALLPLIKGR
jgi:hypothetical protein